MQKEPTIPKRYKQEKNFYTSEIDGNLMLLNEKSLITTITSQLPTEIEKFKKKILVEIQTIDYLKVYEKKM